MSIALRAAFPRGAEAAGTTVLEDSGGNRPRAVDERRRKPRAPYVTPVHVTLPDGTVDGRSEEVSEGGMLILGNAACAPGARVNVRFAMPIEGRVVGCDAYVRWSRPARPDAPEGRRAFGVEFIDPPEALVASIARYVSLMGT